MPRLLPRRAFGTKAVADRASSSWNWLRPVSPGPRTRTSRSSFSTRPGGMPSSPPSASASCHESSTSASSGSSTTTRNSSTLHGSPTPRTKSGLRDFLRLKYRGIRFDLVIAMQDVAVEFVNRNRDSLFPDTPVVFLANSRTASVGPNSTGLIHERNFTATLALIEKLQPDVRNVFVVTGAAPADKAYEERDAYPDAVVRIPTDRQLPVGPSDRRAGAAAGEIARTLRRLLFARHRGRRREQVPPVGIRRPRRGRGQRPDLLLGRLGDGSRHRRWQSLQPDGGDWPHRSTRPPCAPWRKGRQHRHLCHRSELEPGRLAPASAVGHR